MNSKEIAKWCIENRRMIGKVILKYDRYPDNFEDNYNQIVSVLMKKAVSFNSLKGGAFSTYAYTIANNEMIEYVRKKRYKLSYPHYYLTRKDTSRELMNSVAEKGKTFGSIPDYVEAKAGAKDLSSLEDELDRINIINKVNYIIENYLPPVQKRLMKFRYNKNLECIDTLVNYGLTYGVSPAAAFGLEKSAIKNIQKRLGLIKA